MRVAVLTVVTFLALTTAGYGQQCLHDAGEQPEQRARRQSALAAARMVNTIQYNRPEARERIFLNAEQLAVLRADVMVDPRQPGTMQRLSFAPDADIVPGWRLTLDVTKAGYWFAIKDTTDPCGFAYISNDAGVIFTAQPLR